MNKTETNHLIRWILIIPGTLGAAVLGLACGLAITGIFVSIADVFEIFSFLLPATTAIIWVGASYYIAPSHQLIIVWVSWVIGSLVVTIWLPYLPPLWVSALGGGLLASFYYTHKIKTQ